MANNESGHRRSEDEAPQRESDKGQTPGEELGDADSSLVGDAIDKGVRWAAGVAAKGADALGDYRATSQKIRSAFGRGLEKIGAVDMGTQALKDQAEVKSYSDRYTAAYNSGDPASRAEVERLARTGTGREAAGAILALGGLGKLHEVLGSDVNETHARLQYAESFGVGRDVRNRVEVSQAPDSAGQNEETVNNLMRTRGLGESEARQTARNEAFNKYRVEGIDKMNNNDLARMSQEREADGTITARAAKAVEQLVINGAIGELGGTTDQQHFISSIETKYGSRIRSDAEKKNYELAGNNKDKVDNALRAQGIDPVTVGVSDPRRDAAKRIVVMEQLRVNLPKMSVSEIGVVNPFHIAGPGNYEFVKENFTPDMINKLRLSPNSTLISNMKDHVSSGRFQNSIDEARRNGNKAEARILEKKRDAINALP